MIVDLTDFMPLPCYDTCKVYGLELPRRYRRAARKDHLDLARAREHTRQKVRRAVRRQPGYVHRDIKYSESSMAEGYAPAPAEARLILAIFELYRQQEYMYGSRVYSVEHRIVSTAQPWAARSSAASQGYLSDPGQSPT